MQPDGGQRSLGNFIVERQGMLWDVGVRVGGIAMEREGSLPSFPGGNGGMGAMCGGDVDLKAMPLVDSAGAGWVVGQLGVADSAAEVQNGRGGVNGGWQGDGRGPQFFSGGLNEHRELSDSEWRCPDCTTMAINFVECYECYGCCEGVDDEPWAEQEAGGTGGADGSALGGPSKGIDRFF